MPDNTKKAKRLLDHAKDPTHTQLDIAESLDRVASSLEKPKEDVQKFEISNKPGEAALALWSLLTGPKGEDGKTPTKEELTDLIEPLIPEPIVGPQGDPGKDSTVVGPVGPPGPSGERGIDGVSPEATAIVPLVLEQIKLPETQELILDDGPQIVDKINELDQDGPQIDAKHISNLPKPEIRMVGGMQYLPGTGITIEGNVISAEGGDGSGDVTGPSSSVDNAIVRFNGTTGKIIQDSGNINIDDSANLNLGTTTSTALETLVRNNLTAGGNGTSKELLHISLYSNAITEPALRWRKSRGDSDTPVIINSTDGLGGFYFQGYDGATFTNGAYISVTTSGTPAEGVIPATMKLTTYNTSGVQNVGLNLTDKGFLGIGDATPEQPLEVRSATVNEGALIYNTNATTGASTPLFVAVTNTTSNVSNASIESISNAGAGAADFVIRTGAATASGYGTERVRISGAGVITLSTDLAVTEGGTGASTAAGAVTNLGLDNTKITQIGFTVDGGGSAISTGKVKGFFTCPYAGTIAAWNIVVDAGTATIKVWKIATGTAKPTIANVINTSGVAISSGTAVHSTTLTDFTSTAVAANDIFAFDVTAVATATELTFNLQINKT